jgi:hypothetical protein
MGSIDPGATKSSRNHCQVEKCLSDTWNTIFPPWQIRDAEDKNNRHPVHREETQKSFLDELNWAAIC